MNDLDYIRTLIQVGDIVYDDEGEPATVLDTNWYHETWDQTRLIVQADDVRCPMDYAAVSEVERDGNVLWYEGMIREVQMELWVED
jgi:hypothetical protein